MELMNDTCKSMNGIVEWISGVMKFVDFSVMSAQEEIYLVLSLSRIGLLV